MSYDHLPGLPGRASGNGVADPLGLEGAREAVDDVVNRVCPHRTDIVWFFHGRRLDTD